ncbi:hypothetical protein [Pseudomonas mangrovi]|uniref:Lipocalin-like domain-containing protein n=1 Tax=Pseudomonas mangrovi TaxID=2161748 RepID=A0A2T5P9Q9_9PSED|nr:hypothetical protein [Pseudomonas mangrovi]PTU74474.1 hypothetical protein DBO85_10325 [Pseudomonas mangrovi]
MKKIALIGFSVFVLSGMAQAACKSELYGHWSLTHTSESLDSGLVPAEAPMTWAFSKDGKATLNMPPFLNATSNFECSGGAVIVKKTVPTTLSIVRLANSKLVWKENGSSTYFYFSK